MTAADAAHSGSWRTKHTIDATMGVVGMVNPLVGVIWFGGNLISLAINGKTISENLQEGLDSLNKTFDNVNDIHLARPLD